MVLDWGLNPGPPALEASTLPLGYRGGGFQDIDSKQKITQINNYYYTLQEAARSNNKDSYAKFAESAFEGSKNCTLRGQIDFKFVPKPVDLSEVEEAASIVRRFCTGNTELLI